MKNSQVTPPVPFLTMEEIRTRILRRFFSTFSIALVLIWIFNIINIPQYLFPANKIIQRWVTLSIDSLIVIILAILTYKIILRLLRRLRYLKGFLPVCASCKNIRIEGKWYPIEVFIQNNSEMDLSHGICPECIQKLYPDFRDK